MDDNGLYRLLAWLSPSYPVGAFAYSHGIEWAVEDGRVADEEGLAIWIEDIVRGGSGWSDAVLFTAAYDAADDLQSARDINALAVGLAPARERDLETTAQGSAFLKAATDAWPFDGCDALSRAFGGKAAYPIAVASVAAGHGIDRDAALLGYLHAFAANLVSAGVRLIPLGQTAGQRVLAALQQPVIETRDAASKADLAMLGGIAFLSDIAAMRHETQYTRLFRS